ncbi:phage major capsid protein [Aeromonas veronii]
MNEQIQELLQLVKQIDGPMKEKIDALVAQIEAIKGETAQKEEVEAIKSQLNELKEHQLNLEIKGNLNMTTDNQNINVFELIVKAMSETEHGHDVLTKANGYTNADADSAGNSVRAKYETEILRPVKQRSPFLRLIGSVSAKNEKYTRTIATGDFATNWANENTTNSGSAANTAVNAFKQVTGVYGELIAAPFVTSRILHDSDFDIMGEVQRGVTDKFARVLPDAMLNGDGSNKPKGLLLYRDAVEGLKDDTTRRYDVVQETQVLATKWLSDTKVTLDAIEDFIATLHSSYQPNSKFLMHPTVWASLLKLRATDNKGLLRESVGNGVPPTLAGFEVVTDFSMPSASTAGTVVIAFGDFASAFTLVEVQGMTMIADPYKVKGNIELYHSQRFGSLIGDLQAVKFLTLK